MCYTLKAIVFNVISSEAFCGCSVFKSFDLAQAGLTLFQGSCIFIMEDQGEKNHSYTWCFVLGRLFGFNWF